MGVWVVVALLVATTAVNLTVGSINEETHQGTDPVAVLADRMDQKFEKLFDRLDRLEMKVNRIVENHNNQCGGSGGTAMDEGGPVSPTEDSIRHHSGSMEAEIRKHLNQVNRLENILSEIASAPTCKRDMALVRQPVVLAAVNTSQNMTCESYGQPLDSCLWVYSANGTRQVIAIDHPLTDNERKTTVDGVNFVEDSGDLEAGRCTINIESVAEEDAGLWSCTLISKNATIFSGAVLLTLEPVDGDSDQGKLLHKTGAKCADYKTKCMIILKQVFDEAQHCAPCPGCDTTVKGKLDAAEDKLQQKQRTVNDLTALMMTPESQKQPAHVPQSRIEGRLNASSQLSCESPGMALSICLWQRKVNGQGRILVIGKDLVAQGGAASTGGVKYFGDGLDYGKCGLEIESTTEDDMTEWTCTLITSSGQVFAGVVNVVNEEEAYTRLYFATEGEGIKAYLTKTSEVTAVINSTEYLYATVYDKTRKKLYWTNVSSRKMYRSESNGTDIEILLDLKQYGDVRDMDSDWITGNIYLVSWGGYVVVCNGHAAQFFKCATVMSGQGSLLGIALNPSRGTMYVTKGDNSIMKVDMDGSNARTIVTGLNHPCGIAIDFSSSRLYWADFSSYSIKTSDLDGADVTPAVHLSAEPYGIAIAPQRLYWTFYGEKKVQSSTMTGSDIRTIYTGHHNILHLALTGPTVPSNWTNPCVRQSCPTGVCTLMPTSCRCLA